MGETHTSRIRRSEITSELKFSNYLEVARRRKWHIILSALALTTVATVLADRLPNIYRAETAILVNSAEVPDKYVPTIVTADIAARLTTLQQQVLSPTRLKKLVESEHLYPDPTGKLTEGEVVRAVQKSIVVEVVNPGVGKMGAFRIAYSGRVRTDVARIANHLAQMFIETNLQAREDQTQGTAEFLMSQLQETKKQLEEKDAQLRVIKSQNILDLPESKPYHMEALTNLRAQVQTIQDKISQSQREKAMVQSLLNSGGGVAPTINAESGSLDGPPASPYQVQIQNLESRLAELRTRYGPGHPDVRRTQAELNRLKEKAANEPQSAEAIDQKPALTNGGATHRNPVLEAQLEKLDEDIKEQRKLLQPLQDRMDFHTSKLQHLPVFEAQMARLQQDYDILKTQYTQLLEKEKAAEISHALEVRQKGEHFEVLDSAVTPDKPSSPNRDLFRIGGLVGGLLLGITLAAIAEVNDESVRTESEAEEILGKPILSGVPLIITPAERRKRIWRGVGMLAGTAAGSVALGFLFAIVSERFF